MKRRTATIIALCSTLLAATAAFVPTVRAGTVAWGVSIGGPGFGVAVGQPGYYGGHGYYRAPFVTVVRPYHRPNYRYRSYYPTYRAPIVVPPVAYPYYAPAPVYYPYSPR
jgi:hypothetical protein